MQSHIFRILLLLILPSLIAATCGSCIGDQEVRDISTRWLNSFATNGSPIADAATRDIVIYDEGATNGSTLPEVTNRKQLADIIAASAYGGGGVTDVTYSIVFTFHTCDRIALRWQEHAVTTDNVGYGSHVKAGKKIQFKGTDLLTVDLGSRKIKEVYTSADLLNYYRALDYDLGVWSA